jgi:voltage-gated potassium channel
MNRAEPYGRRLAGPVLTLAATLLAGTFGYILIEGWPPDDALYMTITTISTVGFSEVRPLSRAGRLFTVALILVGVGALFYTFSSVMVFVFEGHLTQRWERRRMERAVSHLADHYILCGYGRVGRQIAHELRREGARFVVIDVNQTSLAAAEQDGLLVTYGNAADDQVLRRAGIERACGLITATAEDADNIFVTLSTRALRSDLSIVARANHEDSVPKLRRVGATRVVSPYTMAGQQMAMLAVRPAAVDFVETLLGGAGGDLLLEDIQIEEGAPLVGLSVAAARRRFASGATLLALRRDERMLAPPPVDLTLRGGDVIALAGTDEQLRLVERACSGGPDAARDAGQPGAGAGTATRRAAGVGRASGTAAPIGTSSRGWSSRARGRRRPRRVPGGRARRRRARS